MKRNIKFNTSPIDGGVKRFICGLIPILEEDFEQRKNYDEYYLNDVTYHFDTDEINRLSEVFKLEINSCSLTIFN